MSTLFFTVLMYLATPTLGVNETVVNATIPLHAGFSVSMEDKGEGTQWVFDEPEGKQYVHQEHPLRDPPEEARYILDFKAVRKGKAVVLHLSLHDAEGKVLDVSTFIVDIT